MTTELDIGEVVQSTGVPTSTLHLWEKHGLITSTGRNGLRRQYDPAVINRIAIIVLCQRSSFSLAEIGGLLAPDAFDEGKAALDTKLAELREQRNELDAAIKGIEHALACSEDNPLECSGFLSKLEGVLPVAAKL